MTVLIYTDSGADLTEAFDYLVKEIKGYINTRKWEMKYSHSHIRIKPKSSLQGTDDLYIVGRCHDVNKIKGVNPEYFYSTSSQAEVEEYLLARGSKFLHRIASVKTLVLEFMNGGNK